MTRTTRNIVCERNGSLLGYAYTYRHMERDAYQWGAELSVYLDRAVASMGLRETLYRIVIGILRTQGVRTVYGDVTLPNSKNKALHASLGFHVLGTYRNAGYKNGAWHEKQIAKYDAAPAQCGPSAK